MSKHHYPLIAFLLSLSMSSSGTAQTGDVDRVHDPCIIRDGDAYYLFSTHGTIGIRRSTDLVEWERIGSVFEELPAWTREAVPRVRGLWAPDISFFDDEFHLYYSVSSFGSNRSCIGLATNKTLDPKSPHYRWIDRGMVIASKPGRDNWNAIDPNIVLDEKEVPWLSFGSFWSGNKLCRLDRKTGTRADDQLYSIAGRDGGAIEAPFIIRKQGYYYQFVSFDYCCRGVRSTYKIMVGRSKKVTGPYVDRAGKPMMKGGGTLILAGYGRFRGPGHNAVLREKEADWLVHHFYDAEARGRSKLQIRRLVWDKDGWPLAGEPIDPEPSDRAKSPAGVWEHSVDFGEPHEITLGADGSIRADDRAGRWSLDGRTLTMKWPRGDDGDRERVDEVILAPDGHSYVGRNEQGEVIRGVRVEE